ncbi:MAG: hypothetical protein ACYCSG_02170, partial [Thermoplasmataceae archaeon]
MRIFADGIITLTVFTSLTFYESITEPKCLTRIVTPAMNYAIINYTELAFLIQEGDTGAFLNSY